MGASERAVGVRSEGKRSVIEILPHLRDNICVSREILSLESVALEDAKHTSNLNNLLANLEQTLQQCKYECNCNKGRHVKKVAVLGGALSRRPLPPQGVVVHLPLFVRVYILFLLRSPNMEK